MVVTVRYIFGLARAADGRDTLTVELPPGSTVFEALQRLGLSALELHAAVNGESAADGTVLREGRLHPAYRVCLNGNRFVSDPETALADGDELLLLSADVGG